MKNVILLFMLISSLYLSCTQNNNRSKDETLKNDTTTFFQVGNFINSQIEEVSRTPYYIYKIDITNGKKDSAKINTEIFKKISFQFLKPDISDPAIKRNYTENIFHDQTTQSFTISYSAKDPTLEVRNLEVLLKEDGETVKRIFIRKFFNYADSTAMEQLSWKSGESFRINRLVQTADKNEIERQTIVVWNEKS